MKTNTLLIAIIALLIGGGIGYFINTRTSCPMKMDHSMMNHSMKGMDMGSMMMDMTARMDGKMGDELDMIFLEDMIVHHQGAVDMAMIIKEKTQRPELQSFAQEIIDVQDQEINMMNNWLENWFSSEKNS